MKNWLLPLISGILICCIAIQADAHTVHVPGDQPTIQAGLDAASAGDTVQLACGSYFESAITLKSQVVLLGDPSGAGCAVLEDLANMWGEDLAPGTILADLRIRGLEVGDLESFLKIVNSDLAIQNCVFEDLIVLAKLVGIECIDSSLRIENCRFDTTEGFLSSFIRLSASAADLIGCEFLDISLPYNAAIIADASDLTLTDCVMTGSSGIAAYDGSSLDLSHCEFLDMQDQVLYSAGLLRMESCTIARSRGAIKASGDAELISCSILLCEGPGDAIRFTGGGRIAMEACLVAYNIYGASLQVDAATELAIHCCNFIGNAGGDWVGPLVDLLGVNGNMRQLPKFCDVAYSHDYKLQADSPCAPENNSCAMLIGAWPVGCETTATESRSWSSVKLLY